MYLLILPTCYQHYANMLDNIIKLELLKYTVLSSLYKINYSKIVDKHSNSSSNHNNETQLTHPYLSSVYQHIY